MPPFTLRQLQYLIAVGEAGSVTLAAERVNVSAPSISTAIAQIEAELGLPLFIRRHAQGLVLTEAGRRIMEQARLTLAAARRIEETAAEIVGRVQGPLHLGCLQTFAPILMPGLRRAFIAAHPGAMLHQSEAHQAALIDGLRQGRLDAALTYDLTIPTDLSFTALGRLPPHAILAPDHPLARQDRVTLADLAPEPLILLDLPLSSDYFLRLFDDAGLQPRIAERTGDIGMMRGLVAHGFGYGLSNLRPPSDVAPDGRPLVFRPIAGPVQTLRLGLVMGPGADARQSLRALIVLARDTLPALLHGMTTA